MPEGPKKVWELIGGMLYVLSVAIGMAALGRQTGPGLDAWPQGTFGDWLVTLAVVLLAASGACSAGVTLFLLLKKRRAMFGLGTLALAVLAFAAAALLSHRAKIREWRVNDYSNVRCLPTCAIALYADENDGSLPADLGQLIDESILQGGHLVAPGSGTETPRTGDDVRAGLCDYEYYGCGQRFDRPDADSAILLMSKSTHLGDWVSIAFFDRSTACVKRSSFSITASQRGWFFPISDSQGKRGPEQKP